MMTTNGHKTNYYDRDGVHIDTAVEFAPPIIPGTRVTRCHIYERSIPMGNSKAVHPSGLVTAVHHRYDEYDITIDVSLAELIAHDSA